MTMAPEKVCNNADNRIVAFTFLERILELVCELGNGTYLP